MQSISHKGKIEDTEAPELVPGKSKVACSEQEVRGNPEEIPGPNPQVYCMLDQDQEHMCLLGRQRGATEGFITAQ